MSKSYKERLQEFADDIRQHYQAGDAVKVPDDLVLDKEDVDLLMTDFTNKEQYEAWKSKQVGGNHYSKHKFQVWDIIDEYGLNYYEGNAIKYILRRKDKSKRVEDIQKAIHYLEKLIEVENDLS